MDFYKFWEILNERSFPEPPDTPPEYPHWTDHYGDEDLEWGDWEEDSSAVKVANGHFVDGRNKPLPFLDPYVAQVQGWDQNKMYLDYMSMIGTLRGRENPKTGEGFDDENVRVEIKNLALVDPTNKIELPDRLYPWFKAHFFRGYD